MGEGHLYAHVYELLKYTQIHLFYIISNYDINDFITVKEISCFNEQANITLF